MASMISSLLISGSCGANLNWKLMSDTFWEAYHIKVLHKNNIAPIFAKNLALYDGFNLSHRLVGIRTSDREAARPAGIEVVLIQHATNSDESFSEYHLCDAERPP